MLLLRASSRRQFPHSEIANHFEEDAMKRYVPAALMLSLVLGTLEAQPASAQGINKDALKTGAWTGGLFGTYAAVVCNQKKKCSTGEAGATLGIYTGAGIGTALVLAELGRKSSDRRPSQPVPAGFARVQTLVKPGDRISVRDSSGNIAEGKIESLSNSSLRLRMGRSSRDIADAEIREITQRRHVVDVRMITTGVVLGLAAGAIAIPNTNSPEWCTGKGAGVCVLGSAAIGGAVFAGLSAIPKRNETIFTQTTQTRTSGIDWNISPVISKDRRGAAMSISF
jgi:hypothetical protein